MSFGKWSLTGIRDHCQLSPRNTASLSGQRIGNVQRLIDTAVSETNRGRLRAQKQNVGSCQVEAYICSDALLLIGEHGSYRSVGLKRIR